MFHLMPKIFDLLKVGGLPFLFLLLFFEGNPIIGSFIPGQVLVMFIGFMISTSHLFNIYLTFICVFTAALLGDITGFWMGRKFGFNGLKKFGLNKDGPTYKSSYSFFKKYGAWSIIFGREFNLTRAFMPFFAGCFEMRFYTFFIFSTISCLFWTILSIFLGYYFGIFIINKFAFVMELLLLVIIYLIILNFVYKNIKSFYFENISFIKRYSVHNIMFVGLVLALCLFMAYITKWGYFQIINDYLAFLYIPGMYIFFGFLTSEYFLLALMFVLFGILLWKRKYRMLITYIWSLIFFVFMTLMAAKILMIWYNAVLYFSISFFTLLMFYTWILLRLLLKNKKLCYVLNILIGILIIVVLLSMFSLTGNIFITFLSFLIGVIETEFLLILSHYQILDKCLSNCRYQVVSD